MSSERPHVPRALPYLAGVTLVLLVAQYLLGLWTSAYAPSMFSSSDHSFAPLGFHVIVGYLVGIVAVGMLIVAVPSRYPRYIAQSTVVVAAIAVAGLFGMLFVSSTPNDPVYSFGMGLMFLVAFGTNLSLAYSVWANRGGPHSATPAGMMKDPAT